MRRSRVGQARLLDMQEQGIERGECPQPRGEGKKLLNRLTGGVEVRGGNELLDQCTLFIPNHMWVITEQISLVRLKLRMVPGCHSGEEAAFGEWIDDPTLDLFEKKLHIRAEIVSILLRVSSFNQCLPDGVMKLLRWSSNPAL